MSFEILCPNRTLQCGGETVTVRELSWPEALAFIGQFADRAAEFSTPDGRLQITSDRLAALVTGAQDLAETLILKSTGQSKAWLDQRTFAEGLALLEAAVDLNIRPDFFDRLARIGARFGVSKPKTTSPPPSTSSSGKDTAAPT